MAPAGDGQEEILDAIRLAKALGVKVSLLSRLLEVVGSSSTFDEVDGIWMLGVRPYGLARSIFGVPQERGGRFLGRTFLDELPQLINVLRGDMSLVGPRPLVSDEDGLIEGWRRRRLAVRPGMTGLWQIYGSSRIPMKEMVKIDYMYGATWSIWLDLRILFRTIPDMLSRRGL
jgi:hypothetical protein